MTTNTVDDYLAEARRHITVGDYDKARKALKPIRHHKTAQKWLAQLDVKQGRKPNRLRKALLALVLVLVIGGTLLKIRADNWPANQAAARSICYSMQAESPSTNLHCDE